MSIFDGNPQVATAEQCKLIWGCSGKPGERFRCCLCGHKFIPGDTFRFVYTNDTVDVGGNPFVCSQCDGTRPQIIKKLRAHKLAYERVRHQFWWFIPNQS